MSPGAEPIAAVPSGMDTDDRFRAVEEALRSLDSPVNPFSGAAAAAGGAAVVIQHLDITCDGCEAEPIVGKRFKCQVCEDRDLCEPCMRALIAARLKMAAEAGPPGPAPRADAARPKRWISRLRSDDGRAKWGALLQAVPCLHPSHAFARMDWGPERAVVLTLPAKQEGEGEREEGGSQGAADGDAAAAAAAQRFLDTFVPSRASCADVAWLIVDVARGGGGGGGAAPPADLEDRVEAALEGWERVTGSRRRPTAADVDALAKRHGVLRGKWIAFPKSEAEADAAWAGAVGAAAVGRLPGVSQVKVSATNPREPGYVLCAYTEDYLNAEEVGAAAEALRAALPPLSDTRLLYKSDIYTHLGIYSRNEWGLKPTIYSASTAGG